jgi:hypothetical protein
MVHENIFYEVQACIVILHIYNTLYKNWVGKGYLYIYRVCLGYYIYVGLQCMLVLHRIYFHVPYIYLYWGKKTTARKKVPKCGNEIITWPLHLVTDIYIKK